MAPSPSASDSTPAACATASVPWSCAKPDGPTSSATAPASRSASAEPSEVGVITQCSRGDIPRPHWPHSTGVGVQPLLSAHLCCRRACGDRGRRLTRSFDEPLPRDGRTGHQSSALGTTVGENPLRGDQANGQHRRGTDKRHQGDHAAAKPDRRERPDEHGEQGAHYEVVRPVDRSRQSVAPQPQWRAKLRGFSANGVALTRSLSNEKHPQQHQRRPTQCRNERRCCARRRARQNGHSYPPWQSKTASMKQNSRPSGMLRTMTARASHVTQGLPSAGTDDPTDGFGCPRARSGGVVTGGTLASFWTRSGHLIRRRRGR